MILFLRLLFIVVIASMLGVTTWASLHQPLGDFARSATIRDPWVIATLFDAYWAFISRSTFGLPGKSSPLPRARAVVHVAIIAARQSSPWPIYHAPWNSSASPPPRPTPSTTVFTRRNPGTLLLPGALTAACTAVYLVA